MPKIITKENKINKKQTNVSVKGTKLKFEKLNDTTNKIVIDDLMDLNIRSNNNKLYSLTID